MSEQKIKWVNLHPVLCAPPTQAELDAQRRRAIRRWFCALGAAAAIEFCLLIRIVWGLSLGLSGSMVGICAAFFAAALLIDRMPWSAKSDWSPMTGEDLPRLREVFAPDVLAADAVEQYRKDVAALHRPLVWRDLRIIAEHRQAVRTWMAQEASARELAMFNEAGERNPNLEA